MGIQEQAAIVQHVLPWIGVGCLPHPFDGLPDVVRLGATVDRRYRHTYGWIACRTIVFFAYSHSFVEISFAQGRHIRAILGDVPYVHREHCARSPFCRGIQILLDPFAVAIHVGYLPGIHRSFGDLVTLEATLHHITVVLLDASVHDHVRIFLQILRRLPVHSLPHPLHCGRRILLDPFPLIVHASYQGAERR